MSEEIYSQFQELLDRSGGGWPRVPDAIEILKVLFTKEEAKTALGLSFRPLGYQEVADRAGVAPDAAKRNLDAMAGRGLLFASQSEGGWYYMMPSPLHLIESPYWHNANDDVKDRLTPLMKGFLPVWLSGKRGTGTSFLRVIPIEEEIENTAGVLPYERIDEIIDQAGVIGVTNRCSCRAIYKNCDAPTETCIVFDETCTFNVERGLARYLTKEEAKAKLRECDEAGLVHQAANDQDKLYVVCNCCPCCCMALRAMMKHGNANATARSAFVPVTDSAKCKGCAVCVDERCPTDARTMASDGPVWDDAACIGCGLCATGCPSDAITMTRSENAAVPPSSFGDMQARILQESGKLEAFMEVMNPKSAQTTE